MNIFHIGVISFETKDTKRELKAIGGIQGYILELIKYSLLKNISTGLIGKVYNYRKINNFNYFEIQKKLSSTNKFLTFLFLKSIFIKLPKRVVIHAHRPDHFAAFSFFRNNPSVISLHGQQAKTVNDRKGKWIRFIYNSLEKYALKKSNAIVAVDAITKDYYQKLYPNCQDKLYVIPTGVNIKIFKPMDKHKIRKKMGFVISDKIILYVGRIEPPKKVGDIIRAFQLLVMQDDQYKLVIVGGGVLLEEMKNLARSLDLDKNLTFLGLRKRNELPEIFNNCDISVLYSNNEGSPLSIKESLACGIPVVANCVGDVPLVIKNGYNGYLVENESIKELASKMKLAIDKSPELYQNCIDSIEDYTTDKVNQQMINLYKSILN